MATQYTAGLTAGQILTAATLNTIGAAWETYTPTVTAASGAITTFGARNGKYSRINKLVVVMFDFTITNNGTGGTWLNVSKPITSVGTLGGGTGLIGMASETAVFGYLGVVRDNSTTSVLVLGAGGAPGYIGGNNARVAGFFTYEAA